MSAAIRSHHVLAQSINDPGRKIVWHDALHVRLFPSASFLPRNPVTSCGALHTRTGSSAPGGLHDSTPGSIRRRSCKAKVVHRRSSPGQGLHGADHTSMPKATRSSLDPQTPLTLRGEQSSAVDFEPRESNSKVASGDSTLPASLVSSNKAAFSGAKPAALQEVPVLKVAVDVDEVLGSFLSTLNIFCEEQYGIQHDVRDFYVYDFMKIWKCSQAEANHRVHQFFLSHHFHHGIPPIPGASTALSRLSSFCDLVVVTSRQHVIQEPTLSWLDSHFPGLFQSVHFGNHFALEGTARPKSDICRSLGAHILIDDNPRYAADCAAHGIRVLLFDWMDSYPWSKTSGRGEEEGEEELHPLITRVRTWEEVEVVVTQLAAQAGEPRPEQQ